MNPAQNILTWCFARPLLLLLAAFAVFVLLSHPALDGPLVLDSTKLYGVERQVLSDAETSIVNPPRFDNGFRRIVAMASFTANIEYEGKLVVSSIKAVNVAIHCVIALAVYFLASLILKQSHYRQGAGKWALVIALCWLFAPINFNTALYAIQRMAQLSTLFCLVGMIFYLLGRTAHSRSRATLYYGLLLLAFPLAVFSKGNGILLPAFVLLIELYLFGAARSRKKTLAIVLGCVALLVATCVLAASLYPALIDYRHLDYTLAERLLSQPRAVVSYLQQILVPVGNDIGVYHDDFIVSRSLTLPVTTLFCAVALSVIGFLSFALVQTRYHLAAFGLAFFLVGHLVESTFLPLELYYLHRNYLPSVGLFITLVCIVIQLISATRWKVAIIGVLIVYFSLISYSRSLVWADRQAIVNSALRHHPDSPRALSNYAQQALSQGRLQEALKAVNHAIGVHGGLNYRIQKIFIYCLSGQPLPPQLIRRILTESRRSLAIETGQALHNLHQLYEQGQCSQLPVDAFIQAMDVVKTDPILGKGNVWPIEYYVAQFLLSDKRTDQAEGRLGSALESGIVEAGMMLLDRYLQQQRISDARVLARKLAARHHAQLLEKGLLSDFLIFQQQAENPARTPLM